MPVVFPRCAGLDGHKKTVVACVLIREDAAAHQTIQTFGTTTADLRALATWLTQHQVTHVAMESTGSYWKPIFNLLETTFTTWLVNPSHIQAVPGRKTDVQDSEWIADGLPQGLLQPRFIPDRAQRELRELTRYRVDSHVILPFRIGFFSPSRAASWKPALFLFYCLLKNCFVRGSMVS